MSRDVRLLPLREQALVAVVAPSGPPRADHLAALDTLPALLVQAGWRSRVAPGCWGPPALDFLAADDSRRLADLQAALDDPEVDAVLALRGGYGAARLLPGLRPGLDKPLIGYSDITALHAWRVAQGRAGWHAPMPLSDWFKPGGETDRDALFQQLRLGLRAGDLLAPPMAAHALSQGTLAAGRLLGGNLSVFCALLGTRWMPDCRGALLFFEDIGEAPYRVDRLLTQLRQAGVLEAAAGFVLGHFSEAEPVDALLAAQLHALGKPVLAGWPAGHGRPNLPLPLGLAVELDVPGRCLRVL